MKPFGILAWPAWSNKKENPYNYLLYSNLEKKGYEIHAFTFNIKNVLQWIFSRRYRVFHIHWPTDILTGKSYFHAWRYLMTLTLFIRCIKIFNKKIVWTVHNLEAHETRYPSLQKQLDRLLYRNVDGFISLNKDGVKTIRDRTAASGQTAYVPHPHYQGYYPMSLTRDEAMQKLGIPPGKFVFLFLGQIRKYKNVTGLVKAYNSMAKNDSLLLIAGSVHHEIKAELDELIKDNSQIKLIDAFVKDEDIDMYMKAADLVVTPYERIFNSGSVFLNMSFDRATLAPALAAMPGLEKQVGSRWIKLYKGSISENILQTAMNAVRKDGASGRKIDLSHFDPAEVASQTADFYHKLLGDYPRKAVQTGTRRETSVNV